MNRHFSVTAGSLLLGNDSAKVRPGSNGDHKSELPKSIADRIDQIWAEEIAEPFGLRDFEVLESQLGAGHCDSAEWQRGASAA